MSTSQKPNIVLIIADDQQHNTIHALGNEEIHTPTLDSLAERGTAFTHTYITGGLTPAVCVPGRACINTGCHTLNAAQGRHLNVWPHLMTINPERQTLGATFKEAGYTTFATGKWHNDRASFIRSFTGGANIFFGGMSEHTKVPVYDFDPSGEYKKENKRIGDKFSTELFTDAATQFIREYREDKPFFLYLAYTSPHDPRTAPEPFASMYHRDNVSLPPNFMPVHPFDNGEMTVRDELLEASPRDPGSVRRHIADYYAMVSHMDHYIGQVVEALRESGQLDNTIIVHTADHGLGLGQHGLMGKQNLYDHTIRIPLILSGPGIPSNTRCEQVVCQFDIYPTLCDLAGIQPPAAIDGQSLVPLMQGEAESAHKTVFSVYKDLQRMVSDGEWKLIRYYRPEEHNYGTDRIQLFHLAEDPWETNDLSADPHCARELERLAAELKAWQQRMNDPWAYRPTIPPVQQAGVWGNWVD
jgi:arylsulfatase A-like enzyme